ncbi:FBXW7 protein, partial [Polyodon spathula]|nr:FBXW7 protein [Polyodon spathula]
MFYVKPNPDLKPLPSQACPGEPLLPLEAPPDPASGQDFVLILPPEVSEAVLAFLPPRDLLSAACCSRAWRERANTDSLWQPLCAAEGWLDLYNNQELFGEPQHSCSTAEFLPPTYSAPCLWQFPWLTPTCPWKQVYLRASHLRLNWEGGRYTVVPPLRGHRDRVNCLDCDGRLLVSGSADRTARVWDVRSARCLCVLEGHTDAVTCVSVKAGVVVTGCADGLLRVFQEGSSACLRVLRGHTGGAVEQLCFDGSRVLSAGADWDLRWWSVDDGLCKQVLRGHQDDIQSMVLRGSLAVSSSWDESLRLWDVQGGHCLHRVNSAGVVVLCCQFDGRVLVTGDCDGGVSIYPLDRESGELGPALYCQGHTSDVITPSLPLYCLMMDDSVICSGSADSTVRVWSFTGSCLHTLSGHIGVVRCLHLLKGRLLSGGDRKKILVWDVSTGQLLNCVHRNPSLLHAWCVSDTRIVTASPEPPGTLTVLSYW